MKKRQMKNYFKTGILLIGISLMLWNCQKENEFPLESSSTEISKEELSKKKSGKDANEINKAKLWFEQNSELNEFNMLEVTKTIDWEYAFVSKKKWKCSY
ncbi:hypothetical protein EC396_09490 [Lutibacter sp. HS1-25]|uniref:hypothetical protein n=1 Tax=Lutibacter sp. HS1-25 TaxID=2485000 RepID=UPI001011FEB6|nr:hypothetical protein [Lutibacter sp. HS1-25]RXP54287.1 hypothetical protein EC396_09490 [Lutibacter sp. HS1-25]